MTIEARQVQGNTLFIRRHIEFHCLAPGIARKNLAHAPYKMPSFNAHDNLVPRSCDPLVEEREALGQSIS